MPKKEKYMKIMLAKKEGTKRAQFPIEEKQANRQVMKSRRQRKKVHDFFMKVHWTREVGQLWSQINLET